MIRRIPTPLPIDEECRQVCCHFDENAFHAALPDLLSLTLPTELSRAVPKRKAEFIAGRYCAREALALLANSPFATGTETIQRDARVGIGANREPLWPGGVVGSITHSHGYASAVVARRDQVRAVGVDTEKWIEPDRAENIKQQILTRQECHAEQQLLFDSPLHYLTLVFSAKESLFKCLFPLVNTFFDFHAAAILLGRPGPLSNGEFRFKLLTDLNDEFRAGYSGAGSYCADASSGHTAIIIKAQPGK
ncbi:MAG: 4'-phosphopantetheinyl transferase superfamily protein [Pseudohongiella sp.]|uniref:4'-phosphopantetheinyl transferase n=1 Tax=Pseudohongiella sp. TaxID=1979412 RepID=UPI0034A04715